MTQVHSHYENLRVARNAPPEVIRAAYRVLSQRHHPDVNPGDEDAVRVMTLLNIAYETLSDPSRRREHDHWIEEQEAVSHETVRRSPAQKTTRMSEPDEPSEPVRKARPTWKDHLPFEVFSIASHLRRHWGWYIAVITLWAVFAENSPEVKAPAAQSYARQAPVQLESPEPRYIRPVTAPNGQPWPVSAGYINGYQQLHEAGLSTVTVDNSQNDSDVFVKLVYLDDSDVFVKLVDRDSAQVYPVRQFYIPAFGSFTMNKITKGKYDIRYRDLSNGGLSRSEAFNLEETSTYDGTQFSNITMTLYKVQNGNMQTYGLSETEF